jgi:hypothetical protein
MAASSREVRTCLDLKSTLTVKEGAVEEMVERRQKRAKIITLMWRLRSDLRAVVGAHLVSLSTQFLGLTEEERTIELKQYADTYEMQRGSSRLNRHCVVYTHLLSERQKVMSPTQIKSKTPTCQEMP